MKIFGSISELVSLVFRLSGGKTVQILTSTQTGNSTTVYIPDLGATTSQDMVLTATAQTLTNKTLTAPTINNATISGIASLSLDDTDSSYNLTLQSTSTLAANRALTFDVNDGSRTLEMSGNINVGANFTTTTGAVTLAGQAGGSSVELPSTGKLVTETGSVTLTNKTIDGDDNTLQDISISSLKTVLADANKVVVRDASGVITSALIKNDNVTSVAADAIVASKIKAGSSQYKVVITGANGLLEASATTMTGDKALVSNSNGVPTSSTTSATELGYVAGVTSGIQGQLDAKQATITGGASSITSSNLTASRALSSDASGKVAVSATTSTELGYVSGVTSGIQTQLDAKVASNASITGATKTKITYDAKGLVTAGADLAAGDLPTGIDAAKIGSGLVSNTEFGYLDGVTSAIQTQIDAKQATITGAATSITSSNLTASRALSSDASGKVAASTTTSTELGYLSGVTSAVQTQIDGKQATITGGASSITSSNLTASRALSSDASGKVAVSATTATELGYVSGVTSAIQTQLNTKAASGANTDITSLQGVTLNGKILGSGSATIATSTLTPAANRSLQLIASAANFGMIASPVAGQQYVLVNESASDITIQNLTGATAANQIYTGTGADYTFKAKSAVSVVYDGTLSKWMLTGGGAGGGLSTSYVTAGGITAVAGTHYLTNLSASGQTITLPAGVSGSVIRFSDAGEVWDVYPLTIAPASGEKIDKLATNETLVCDVKRGWVELSYNSTFGGWALMSLASTTGSAAGSGEINAVLNASAASDTTGWTNATRVSSGSPLDPVVTTALSIANAAAAESSTSGGYYSIATMPSSLKSRKLKLEFYYSTPATDVYKVSVYAGSTRLALSSDSSGATSLPASVTGGFFSASFDATTASAYSVNITRTSGSTGAITVTNVVVGPGIVAQGAAISEWQSYTPTFSAGIGGLNVSTINFWYRRVGSDMEIQGSFLTQTVSASVATFTLPNNLTIGNSAVAVRSSFGEWYGQPASATTVYNSAGVLIATALGANTVGFDYQVAASTSVFTPRNGATVFNSNSIISLKGKFPIAEWAGNGTVNLGQGASVEYAYNSSTSTTANDSTSFAYGPGGKKIEAITAGLSRRVRFQYPIQSDDILIVEVSEDQLKWVPTNGGYITNAAVTFSFEGYQIQNGTTYGIGRVSIVNSTDVDVYFGTYARASSTYGAAGDAWSTNAGNFYWRVRKAKASAPVGFGLATADQAGLLRGYSNMTKIRLHTGNGYGSTNTAIRRFSTAVVNTGTGITYADSAANGASFTVTEAGIYAITYCDTFNAAGSFGISLNSSQLTTSIANITAADRVTMVTTGTATYLGFCSATLALSVGDVIRPHAEGVAESVTPARVAFTVQRIG